METLAEIRMGCKTRRHGHSFHLVVQLRWIERSFILVRVGNNLFTSRGYFIDVLA